MRNSPITPYKQQIAVKPMATAPRIPTPGASPQRSFTLIPHRRHRRYKNALCGRGKRCEGASPPRLPPRPRAAVSLIPWETAGLPYSKTLGARVDRGASGTLPLQTIADVNLWVHPASHKGFSFGGEALGWVLRRNGQDRSLRQRPTLCKGAHCASAVLPEVV